MHDKLQRLELHGRKERTSEIVGYIDRGKAYGFISRYFVMSTKICPAAIDKTGNTLSAKPE